MAASDVSFGITLFAGALIESVDVTSKIDKKELRGSDGNVARVHAYNPTKSFSVKGHGALSLVPGFAASGITSLSGGLTLIEERKDMEKNDDFNGWEFSGINYPTAQSV